MPRPIHCILLIDDDPDDNAIHQLIIEESGVCDIIRIAENGYLGLAYLSQTDHPDYVHPDLILLDINMPGMNGFDFLEQYSQLDESLRTNTILMMLTTSVIAGDRNRGGVFKSVKGFLTKPISKEVLRQISEQHFS